MIGNRINRGPHIGQNIAPPRFGAKDVQVDRYEQAFLKLFQEEGQDGLNKIFDAFYRLHEMNQDHLKLVLTASELTRNIMDGLKEVKLKHMAKMLGVTASDGDITTLTDNVLREAGVPLPAFKGWWESDTNL